MNLLEAKSQQKIAVATQRLQPQSMLEKVTIFLKRPPLWIKIMLSLLLALIIVVMVAGELMRLQLQADYSASLRKTSEDTFLLLTAAALEPVISEDIPQLRSIVNETARLQPDIHAIRIMNEEGVLLASLSRGSGREDQNLVSFSKTLSFESEVFGVLSIDWSTERLDNEVMRHINMMRYWVIASLLILTLIILVLIHFFAVRPIGKIHQHLLALNKGNLKSRIDIHSSRELSLLSNAVNDLTDALVLQRLREAELESAREELFEAKEAAEVTLHSIGDGVISTDVDGNVQYLNPVSERLTGWSSNEACGQPIARVFRLIDEVSREPLPCTIRNCLDGIDTVVPESHPLLIGRNGQESAIDKAGSPIRSRSGEIIGAVMIFHDVTASRNMTRELQYQAAHDSLTDLINRKEFDRQLFQYREDLRHKDQQHTLLYIDLDQFKIVNDTCGHAAGDALLQQLSQLIGNELRRGDIFARLGGDEFGILLNECPLSFGIEIAESIRRSVERFRFVWNGIGFSIGTSIGIVAITPTSADAERLLEQADEACYSAKELGRNRYHVYTYKDDQVIGRQGEMNWLGKVNAALAEDRFVLYQQTILPLQEGGSSENHIEILVRLIEPDGSVVLPCAFIPAAERYGLMPKVDHWVVSHTMDWFRRNPEKMKALVLCNINLSGKSLSDDALLRYIEAQLDSPEIDASKFCFELTETAAVSNLALALNFIQRLKQKGCLFALDDFGSGMSSFGYLKILPVDYLKIDGMFVKDIVHDKTSRTMVASIHEVGHVMGKRTIAEFVENDEILEHLREMGVDFAQGYCISRPAPLE
ncbi:EAL domain-containing protein [Amphritea sp. 2_MG-2023]|uniref:EAL domain-containing protein n=1 Tax=Amphritea TaxID=515417 RepID=UPI001C07158A|nr:MULTISPECIES: EAL domain-containing protein [Amphritea]MBU2967456.1 EAL domain-containing protein [Amphritea atlantica]MDO6418289.1 EAL domain-containing protein [Amphritea sp. 2_MG-2023]